ncbi:hypothetical protein ONS96_012431 [Cadophora gregata f. sp. sojae]|nr:hypothetical protein ONS96_012431 [Cadophora gregata f. sp. sojae]
MMLTISHLSIILRPVTKYNSAFTAQSIEQEEVQAPTTQVKATFKEKQTQKVYLPRDSNISPTNTWKHLISGRQNTNMFMTAKQQIISLHESLLANNALHKPPVLLFGDTPERKQSIKLSQQTTFLICFLSSPSAEALIQASSLTKGTKAPRKFDIPSQPR